MSDTTRRTFQHKHSFSINRELFKQTVVNNKGLTRKELIVTMHLLTFLDGYTFKEISKKNIAEDLNMSKSDVKKVLEELMYTGIIEKGSTEHTSKGYRFTF